MELHSVCVQTRRVCVPSKTAPGAESEDDLNNPQGKEGFAFDLAKLVPAGGRAFRNAMLKVGRLWLSDP